MPLAIKNQSDPRYSGFCGREILNVTNHGAEQGTISGGLPGVLLSAPIVSRIAFLSYTVHQFDLVFTTLWLYQKTLISFVMRSGSQRHFYRKKSPGQFELA